jgi:hypothetical protein
VSAGWILFRSPNIGQAARMLGSMFTFGSFKPAYPVNDYLFLAICFAEYLILEPAFARRWSRDPLKIDYSRWIFWLRPVAYAALVQLIFMYDRSNVAFIYFQF